MHQTHRINNLEWEVERINKQLYNMKQKVNNEETENAEAHQVLQAEVNELQNRVNELEK